MPDFDNNSSESVKLVGKPVIRIRPWHQNATTFALWSSPEECHEIEFRNCGQATLIK